MVHCAGNENRTEQTLRLEAVSAKPSLWKAREQAEELLRETREIHRLLEPARDAVPVRDATAAHQHADRKMLHREREKKIALGHREDGHEEEQTWQRTL